MAIINDDDSGNHIGGTPQDDIINGNGGDDHLGGADGDDRLDGGAGDDHLGGGRGADSMVGGDGDDHFQWIDPDDVLADGGAGNDRAELYLREATAAYTYDLSDPAVAQTSNGLTLVGLEGLWFDLGAGDDVVTGTPLFDLLWGWLGDDTLRSDPGFVGDFLSGYLGADTLIGGPGPDTIDTDGEDKLIDGGAGDDLLQYVAWDVTRAVTLSLATPWIAQTVNGTIIRNMDKLSFGGTEGDDDVTGGKLPD
jgi:Ca2+-binding RTX toxin-like protein